MTEMRNKTTTMLYWPRSRTDVFKKYHRNKIKLFIGLKVIRILYLHSQELVNVKYATYNPIQNTVLRAAFLLNPNQPTVPSCTELRYSTGFGNQMTSRINFYFTIQTIPLTDSCPHAPEITHSLTNLQ